MYIDGVKDLYNIIITIIYTVQLYKWGLKKIVCTPIT